MHFVAVSIRLILAITNEKPRDLLLLYCCVTYAPDVTFLLSDIHKSEKASA